MVQVKRSQLTVLKLIIPSMCTPCFVTLQVSTSQLTVTSTDSIYSLFCTSVTPHVNKGSSLVNMVSLAEMYRRTDCTLNAAVLLYTHCEEVFQRAMNTLHREEGTSITLIICTTNNCLVERDSYMLFQGASWSESLLG